MTNLAATAVICTYDRYDLLPKAIESLARQTLTPERFEIIIIDNSPDHKFSALFSKQFSGISNLTWATERTPGLSNARNAGIRLARAPVIAFMDDDAIAAPNWLEVMTNAFADFGEDAAVAGGRVSPIWDAPRPDWLHERLLGYVSVVDWGGSERYAAPGEWMAGTNIAFRTEALRNVGGFSVYLGRSGGGQALLSNDETEVIDKVAAAGGRLIYVPNAVMEHLVASERLTQGWFRRRVAWQAVSEYLQNPKASFDKAPQSWRDVTDFFSRLPPKFRTPRGLWAEQDDPELFRRQMSALYSFTLTSLAGFHGLEDE